MSSQFVHNVEATRFDGSNSAEIIADAEAWFALVNTGVNFTSGSQVGQTVQIITDQMTFVLNEGDWLYRDGNEVYGMPDPLFAIKYRPDA